MKEGRWGDILRSSNMSGTSKVFSQPVNCEIRLKVFNNHARHRLRFPYGFFCRGIKHLFLPCRSFCPSYSWPQERYKWQSDNSGENDAKKEAGAFWAESAGARVKPNGVEYLRPPPHMQYLQLLLTVYLAEEICKKNCKKRKRREKTLG